ncbi:hypothetical protein KUTeg_001590 [Tegillarca granosa]|uniref:Uncharacterized protein n=1 Tax=Tegillarca granosa TaxID=220873 RepID=A0ABQ9FRW7_TEGGR|nr:hypothetical protein KUTeg_001590 [Tegillarca granosa]
MAENNIYVVELKSYVSKLLGDSRKNGTTALTHALSGYKVRKLQMDNKELNKLKTNMIDLQEENNKLRGRIINMQSRSMRDNLIFSGLRESPDQVSGYENIGLVVKEFIREKLEIEEEIEFERRTNQKSARNLAGTEFGISEIQIKRRELYPVLRQAKEWKNKAVLVVDKLYINYKLYVDQECKEKTQGEIANVEDRYTISFVPDNRSYNRDRFSSSEQEHKKTERERVVRKRSRYKQYKEIYRRRGRRCRRYIYHYSGTADHNS